MGGGASTSNSTTAGAPVKGSSQSKYAPSTTAPAKKPDGNSESGKHMSKSAFIEEFASSQADVQGNIMTPGKLKKLALGQQGYFDQQRDYDPTLAKLEVNHTGAIEWTQPTGSSPAPAKSVAHTPSRESKEYGRGAFASPNAASAASAARSNPASMPNSNVNSIKTPPAPNRRVDSEEHVMATVRQQGTSAAATAAGGVMSPPVNAHRATFNGVSSSSSAVPRSVHMANRDSDGPSNPQRPSSPAREENYNDSRKTVTYDVGASTAFNTESGRSFANLNFNNNSSNNNNNNHNASGGNLRPSGLISRPFPGTNGLPPTQPQFYTESAKNNDDDMIGVFGTLTLTPGEREGLKRPESVPLLSLSGNAALAQIQLSNSRPDTTTSSQLLQGVVPPPKGVSRPAAPHPSSLKGPSGAAAVAPSGAAAAALSGLQPQQQQQQQPRVVTYVASAPPPSSSSGSTSHNSSSNALQQQSYSGAPSPAAPRGLPIVTSSSPATAATTAAAQRAVSNQYAAAVVGGGVGGGSLPVVGPRPGIMAPQVKETKDVKRARVQMPEALMHARPTTGDWLNKRYIVNDYILLDVLGTGSYGEVRMCKHRTSDKLFAIKIISKDFLKKKKGGKQSGETYFEDIKREIAIMKKLSHPNVLRLFEVLDDPNVNKMYLVLEYMKQGDLINILKLRAGGEAAAGASGSNGFTPLHDFDVWDIFKQVNAGVKYLHRQNIVHGDIKPQNLLLDVNGIVKIADFGISQMLSQSKQELGDAAGTPAFMSPELCEGKSFSGQKADIWAIGATMFMLRFGNPPYVAKSIIALYKKIVNDPLVFPFEIDPALQNLLEHILEKDVNKRFTMNQIMSHPWFIRRPQPPKPSVKVVANTSTGGSNSNPPSRAGSAPSDGSRPAKRDTPAPVPFDKLAPLDIPSHNNNNNSNNAQNHHNNNHSGSDPPALSFQPPDTYDAEEEAAMNAPESTVDKNDIFMSVGGIVKSSQVRLNHEGQITEETEGADEEQNEAAAAAGAQATNMMATNWGDDVFQMVDDGSLALDDGGDDEDEEENEEDGDSVSIKKKQKISAKFQPQLKQPSAAAAAAKKPSPPPPSKSAFETTVDDIDIDSSDEEVDDDVTVSSKKVKKSQKIQGKHERPAASNASDGGAAGKAAALEASAGGAAGAMDSLGESSVHSRDMIMSAEEEARRANRFIKTSAAKKAAGNSSSGALGTVYDSGTSNDSGSDYAIVEHMRARQAATTAAAAATANNSNGKATAAPSAAAAASSNGKLIPSRPTPLQTLQAKNSGIHMHNMLVAAAGGNSSPGGGSSSKAGSPLRSRKASGLDFDDTEALDELDDEQFNSMMDTLSQQPRLGRDRLENDEEVDEEVPPAFNQASLNLEGIESQLFNHHSNIVAAFHSEQGARPHQEDRCVLLPNVALAKHAIEVHLDPLALSTLQHFTLACIFDGHSGWRTSQYLSQHFAPLLVSNDKLYNSKTLEAAVIETFCTIDANVCNMLSREMDGSGSTGIVAVYDGRKHRFTVAGVGDSMCVVSRGGKAVTLNKQHRLQDNPSETQRIIKAGGQVKNCRVNGILAVSRAFGDTQFKEFKENNKTADTERSLVIAVPDITTEIITAGTEFCILASDGLWDMMSPQVAVSFVVFKLQKNGDLQKAARDLCLEAIKRGSIDNVTVLILAFHTSGSGPNRAAGGVSTAAASASGNNHNVKK